MRVFVLAVGLVALLNAQAACLGVGNYSVRCPVPTVEIARGVHMPLVGIGTWQYNDSVAHDAVKTALELGYNHIDTAIGYFNGKGVGEALGSAKLARNQVFVTSKVMAGLPHLPANATMEELAELNLQQLGLDYVDLLLLHFPSSASGAGGAAFRQEQWRSIERFHKAGKARAIGVSHYCKRHIEDIMKVATVQIAVNQVQFHVGMGTAVDNATDYRAYDATVGITYQSFSPLCGPCPGPAHKELITGDLVSSIGKAHGKTGAQVSLKWQVQQKIPVIPKSNNPKHIAQNIDLFGWELAEDEMKQLTDAVTPAVAGGPNGDDSGDCGIP